MHPRSFVMVKNLLFLYIALIMMELVVQNLEISCLKFLEKLHTKQKKCLIF